MAELNTAKIVKRVRLRMAVSQEVLSRMLNATKGAVQHWERGRNKPDLVRLLALRKLAPAGPERRDLDALIKQSHGATGPALSADVLPAAMRLPATLPTGENAQLRRDNFRLARQVAKLESALSDLRKELATLKSK